MVLGYTLTITRDYNFNIFNNEYNMQTKKGIQPNSFLGGHDTTIIIFGSVRYPLWASLSLWAQMQRYLSGLWDIDSNM